MLKILCSRPCKKYLLVWTRVGEGVAGTDDRLPERLFYEAASRGPSRRRAVDKKAFEKMPDEVCACMGRDGGTGVPTQEKPKAPGLMKPFQELGSALKKTHHELAELRPRGKRRMGFVNNARQITYRQT